MGKGQVKLNPRKVLIMTAIKSLDNLDIATPSNEGVEIELLHPTTREPLGMFITVLGKYSQAFIDHQRKATNEYLRKAQQLKKRGKEDDPQTAEKFEKSNIELLVACTASWRTGTIPTLNFEGEDRPCTKANAELLYASPKWAWLRAQVDEEIGDIANFMKS